MNENMLKEGGNAVSGVVRINQDNVAATMSAIYKVLLPKLKLKKTDTVLLGSTGKKKSGESSGDIDFGLNKNAIIRYNRSVNDDEKSVLKHIESVIKGLRQKASIQYGFRQVSCTWPIENVDGKQKDQFVQLDLMLVDNLKYAKFSLHSPAYNESKYKGKYRNILLSVIAAIPSMKVSKTTKTQSGKIVPVAWKKNWMDLNKGLTRGMQSKQGVKGILSKHKTVSSDVITNDPDKIISIVLGSKFKIKDANSYESLMKAINSNAFVHRKFRKEILKTFVANLKQSKLPIPPDLKIYEIQSEVKKRTLNELIHLHDVLSKNGTAFIKKLLNSKMTINTKVDVAAFVCERVGKELKFYGREGKQEIDLIKRASMGLYEKPIEHIESTDWIKLPNRHKVFLELFDDRLQMVVKYTATPKNGLIMSYVETPDGKKIKPNHPINKKIANILQVASPPVLFDGTLNSQQKNALLDFISLPVDERIVKYGGSKFLDFVMGMFVTPNELKWMQADGYEGIVFYFDNDPFIAKIVDPAFTDDKSTKSKSEKGKADTETYKKLTHELAYNSLKKHFAKVLGRFKTSEVGKMAFIDFIGALATAIARSDASIYDKKLKKYKGSEDSKRMFGLGYKHVPVRVKKLIKKHWWAEEMFANLLLLLRAPVKRVRADIGMSKAHKIQMNKYVDQLKQKGLIESVLLEEFDLDEIPEKQDKSVDVFLGRFQPLHIGHQKIIEKMKNPVVVLVKGGKTSKDKAKNPFSMTYQRKLIKKINPGVKIVIHPNGYLPEIFTSLREKGMEPTSVYAGADRISGYRSMIKGVTDRKLPIAKRYNIKFVKTPRITSATKVRDAIRSGDKQSFKKLVPKPLWDEWSVMFKRLGESAIQEIYNSVKVKLERKGIV